MEGARDAEAAVPVARFPLRLKLTLAAVLLGAVPPLAVGGLLIDVNAETVDQLSRDLQLAVAEDVARTIETELRGAEDALGAVGRVLTDGGTSGEGAVALALGLVEGSEGLDHVAVYDAQGALIDTILEEHLLGVSPTEILAPELLTRAAAENVAAGHARVAGGVVRVPVVVPLRAEGRITGFAASEVSMRDVQARVVRLARARLLGGADSIFVVDEQLRVLANADPDRPATLEDAGAEGILQGVDERLLREGFSRSGEYVAARGARVLGSAVSLSRRPWTVVVQVPVDVVYASLGRMRKAVAVTVAITVALALAAGIVLARRITAPLARLAEFAAALGSRRFDHRVEIRTRDELAVVGRAMSRAAAELEAGEARLREEAAIRADLGRYLPAALVDKVVRREQDMALGGVRRPVTVLFADVVGFTPLAERLPAEDVVTVLNELFTILTGIVFRHEGTVDKFVGDCVMALWGAPSPQDDHATRALAAAEDMLKWLEMGNATWKQRFGVTIELAVGIHSGEAVVGNIGSETRMEYTAIGDVVNVAARLEALARPQQVLLTEATLAAAGEGFDVVDVGIRDLAGRTGKVQLYELSV